MSDALLATATALSGAAPSDGWLVWGSVLFGAAVVLLVLELFIPSGGMIGILAGIAMIGSVIAFFRYDSAWGVGVTAAYVVLVPLIVVFFFKYWLNSPWGRRLVLGGNEPPVDDPQEAAARSERERRERVQRLAALVGTEGVAETALRPIGTVRIEGQRLDAMAEQGVIDAGTRIVVVDAYDNQIKVRPAR